MCKKNRGAIAWNLLQLDFCHKSKINPEAFFISHYWRLCQKYSINRDTFSCCNNNCCVQATPNSLLSPDTVQFPGVKVPKLPYLISSWSKILNQSESFASSDKPDLTIGAKNMAARSTVRRHSFSWIRFLYTGSCSWWHNSVSRLSLCLTSPGVPSCVSVRPRPRPPWPRPLQSPLQSVCSSPAALAPLHSELQLVALCCSSLQSLHPMARARLPVCGSQAGAGPGDPGGSWQLRLSSLFHSHRLILVTPF